MSSMSDKNNDNPEFLRTWLRAVLMFLILCVAFAPVQLWLVLTRRDD
jgi:hypothetical protein